MGRKSTFDKYPEAKKRALELYRQGKGVREIAEQISLEFPFRASKSSVQRLISHYRELLKLKDVGVIEDDVDLMAHSQHLSVIANGMITELLVEWKEKGEITSERLKALLDLLSTTSSVAKTTAQIEKIKSQLIQHLEKIMEKVAKALERTVEDEELRRRILVEVKNELES